MLGYERDAKCWGATQIARVMGFCWPSSLPFPQTVGCDYLRAAFSARSEHPWDPSGKYGHSVGCFYIMARGRFSRILIKLVRKEGREGRRANLKPVINFF